MSINSRNNSYRVRLKPVISNNIGFWNFARYEQLGLPLDWIKECQSSRGIWVAPDEYFWTPDSFFLARKGMSKKRLIQIRALTGGSFFELELKQQCKLLKVSYKETTPLQYEEIRSQRGKTLEERVLLTMSEQGWHGERFEGATFFIAMHAIREMIEGQGLTYWPLKWLSHLEPKSRGKLTARELEGLDDAIDQLGSSYIEAVFSNWQEASHSCSMPKVAQKENIKLKDVLHCLPVIKKDYLKDACVREMLGYGVMGWPDLTVIKGKELRFIEVKSIKDKLTQRQGGWCRNFAKPLGWPVTILHIQNSKAAN